MYKALEQCIGELRVNHTDKEITGALSECFQIIKNVSYDYTDNATVKDIREDHPELGFMDDEEIEEILKQATAMRQKREPDEAEQLTIEDIQELFERNKNWCGEGSERQRDWIEMAAVNDRTIEEIAGMIWVCSAGVHIDHIKRTMREYLKEKGSVSMKDASGYDVDLMEECVAEHMAAFEAWPYGDVKKVEMDKDGDLCIHYTGGMYWHYRKSRDGDIEWW